MKKIGIVGGIGWPSTVEYYRLICEASQRYHKDKNFSGPIPTPEISIESLNMNFTVNNRGSSEAGSWTAWDEYFKAAVNRLETSGAELIAIASVTPHTRLEEISKGTLVPIISIYESIGIYCKSKGIENLLVLGTMPTMTSPAFTRGMKRFGINAFPPEKEQLKSKVLKVIEQLYQNKIEGASLDLGGIVRSSVPAGKIDNTAICLGCTELSIAFEDFSNNSSFEYGGINYINSSVLHALSIFKESVR